MKETRNEKRETRAVQGEGMVMCVFGMVSRHFQFQGQSLLIPSVFNLDDPDPSVPCLFSPSFMQAMEKVQLLTCLPSPPRPERPKKEITGEAVPRSKAQNFSQQTVASDCKGCLRLQHTNDCMHADGPGPGPGRKEKGKRGCGIFAIRWRAWQECSSPMHPSDHRMVGQEWRKWYQYSSETAKSVSDCVTGRANGTERRRDAERPKLQSKHRKLEINCYCNNGLPLLKEMEEGKPRDTMLWKLSIKRHQRHQ